MENIDGMPAILYKYRDFANDLNWKTLFEFELYLSAPSQLNDPFEGEIPFIYDPKDLTPDKIFLKQYAMAQSLHPDWNSEKIQHFCYTNRDMIFERTNIEQGNKQKNEFIEKNMGILSLTSDPLNYLMWSYYSKSHAGYCIGFDTFMLFESLDGAVLSRVSYTEAIPMMKLNEEIHIFHQKQLSTKGKFWEHENEYRFVKGYPTNRILKYDPKIIRKIYLGCKMSSENKSSIISFVRDQKLDCEIIELSKDDSFFRLKELLIY